MEGDKHLQSLIQTCDADCNFMHGIFKDRKLALQERGKTKISAFGRTEMFPKPAPILRLMIKQHGPSVSRERIALHPPFGLPSVGPLWLQPARKALDLHPKFTESKQPRVMMNKPIQQRSRADSRTAGSSQQLKLGMSGKDRNQEPTSASEHSQDTERISGSAQWSQKRQQGAELPFCHLTARGVQASQALHRARGHGTEP